MLPHVYVSLSHEIVREYREYERTSTTVMNAYIGPQTSEYVGRMDERLRADDFDGRFLIMQSNGGVMSPATAKKLPVAMMESGPVGGVIAAARRRRGARLREPDHVRHGRHDGEDEPHQGQRSAGRAGVSHRRLCERPSRDVPGRRHRRGRRRRRQHRVDRRGRRAEGRAAAAPAPTPARSATGAAAS